MEKENELKEIEEEFRAKISERERMDMMGRMSSRIISVIAKHLIRDMGYTTTSTVFQREFRKMGREDAKIIAKIFNLEKNNIKNASKALKIAALFLGLKLDIVGNETVVRDCPQGKEAINQKESFLCNVCLEYNKGIIEEMLGNGFTIDRGKWIFKGDEYCEFRISKK